jgi:magnesium chelatase family protein
LFLDEISLFRRDVLDSLRGPLEDGSIRVVRSGGMVTFPARIALIGAMNPCPCGRYGDPRHPCRCDAGQLHRYATKVSGPLLDRFDMQVAMEALTRKELLDQPPGESSEEVRDRVEVARATQHRRFGATNATVSQKSLRRSVNATPEARQTLGDAVDAFGLSGRGFVRVMRVARTIADLNGSERVEDSHIWEALTFRLPDFLAEVA